MMGFQAAGAAPLVAGQPVASPSTVASAIRIGSPASWQGAIDARDESGGIIEAVTDEEILDAYRLLSTGEGIFCEPASAAGVAGIIKLHRQGMDLRDKRVVCVITGSGLKDPELAVRYISTSVKEVSSDLEEVEAALLEFAA
jgi:threonine synthase